MSPQSLTKEYIQEGQAKIYVDSNNREDVFYNPGKSFYSNAFCF